MRHFSLRGVDFDVLRTGDFDPGVGGPMASLMRLSSVTQVVLVDTLDDEKCPKSNLGDRIAGDDGTLYNAELT
jgi:hypothetical protein